MVSTALLEIAVERDPDRPWLLARLLQQAQAEPLERPAAPVEQRRHGEAGTADQEIVAGLLEPRRAAPVAGINVAQEMRGQMSRAVAQFQRIGADGRGRPPASRGRPVSGRPYRSQKSARAQPSGARTSSLCRQAFTARS